MRRQLLPFLALGLVVMGGLLAGVLWRNRGERIELRGAILKVRTQGQDDNSTIAVIDFRFANLSNHPFHVRLVEVSLEDAAGKPVEGMVVSEADAKSLCRYYPLLGQKYNESLRMRDRIPSRQSWDRMLSARFPIPEPGFQARRRLRVRVEDVDGAVSEIVEEKP